MKSTMHHTRMADETGIYTIVVGPLTVQPAEYVAAVDGRRLRLTPKEFELLALFAKRPGRLIRREEIAAEVWGSDAEKTITIHISRLRRKLPPRAIETVPRVGYRLSLE